MKKLLIAMTAAAVGTCAWATDADPEPTPPTVTYLNATFGDNWKVLAPNGEGASTNDWWSYSSETIAEGELVAGDALTLNTGSKVLTGSFASDKDPVAIGTDGLYFKSKVTFKDPSDTLPTLGAQDKFALVVLDNVESCETYNTEENPVVTPATNLWVIAKYGDGVGVKRAYKLKIPVTGKQPEQDENGGDVLTNLDKAWLDVPHEIVVKAYGNVMADSQTPRAGFMVMVDGYICTVDCSCAIEGEGAGVINPTQAGTPVYAGDVYLGFAKDAINGTLNPRYNKNQLLLSMTDNNAKLTSVDFQGQGVIDNVSLATTGADFGPDATVITFTGYDADKIASITVGGKAAVNGVYTITGSETADGEGTVAIIVTVNDGYVLKGEGWTKNGLTYTYAGYTLPTASDEFELNVFAPAAYVGDTAYESLAAAVSAASADSTIDLSSDVELDSAVTITKNLTINLNGKKLSAALSGAFTSMFRFNGNNLTLTITDTANGVLEVTGGDRVLASSARGAATVAINKGAIDAACAVGTGQNTINYVITGGKFLKEANATITTATGYAATDDGTYWVVAPASNYPESDKLVASDTELTAAEKEAVEATFDAIAGAATDKDAAVTNYFTTVYGANVKVPVATITGAKNIGISVANNLPLMTSENAEFVAEATTATGEGNVAAFMFTLKDGNTDDAETLLLSAQTAIQKLIKVCSDLKNNSWIAPTIGTDIDATVTDGKIKVQLKSGKANFMKIQATAE